MEKRSTFRNIFFGLNQIISNGKFRLFHGPFNEGGHEDEIDHAEIRQHLETGLTVVNVGNAHTFAALIREDRMFGIYEHHTGLLTPDKLAQHLSSFQAGELKHEEIFDDNGHGCAIHPDYLQERPFTFTVITGPRRSLARGWPGVFAAPLGDMMLTGCFGLADAWLEKARLPRTLGES